MPVVYKLLAVVLLIGGAWWLADRRGYDRCQAQHAAAAARANIDAVAKERKRDAEGDVIAGEADARAADVVRDAGSEAASAEERIKVVYRDRWLDPAPGRCSVPLDPRVQDEIDAAVRRSNGG